MDSKDLFNAIDKAAEEFVPDLLDSTEGVRPIVLRAEKKPRSVKRIVLGAAACTAAAVVLCAGVTIGMKNYSQHGSLVSASSGSTADNIERNFAPAEEILRVRDVGFYSKGMSDDSRKILEERYKYPVAKENLKLLGSVSSIKPPDVFYFNDLLLDNRMLSHKAYFWLWRYCLMSEEDRSGETVPDEVKYLTGSGIIRFGDLGFLQDKYTERELNYYKECCYSGGNYRLYDSMRPPEPDVYYYDDVPYHTDQMGSEDAENWLKWYCWLDEETQAQLSGYIPKMFRNFDICYSYSEEPCVNYKGKAINFSSISGETRFFLMWYKSLPADLKAKVGYAPQELSEENLKNYPDMELPIELIGADGVPLTYEDLLSEQTAIYKVENVRQGESELTDYKGLPTKDLKQWDEIVCYGFVYLAEPGSNEFKRYNIGDEIMGLKITRATTLFRRFEGVSDPALYYAGGEVTFEGTAKVDVLAFMNDDFMKCEISGLPIIDVDEKARAEGKIVPKQHSADKFADNPAALFNDDSHCFGGGIIEYGVMEELQGQIQRDVEIKEINMVWRFDFDNTKWYEVMAHLSKND